MELLDLEFHLYIQVDSSNNVCSKRRMKIQIEQNKPHMKMTSIIAQEFTVSFTIIIQCYNSLQIGRIQMH